MPRRKHDVVLDPSAIRLADRTATDVAQVSREALLVGSDDMLFLFGRGDPVVPHEISPLRCAENTIKRGVKAPDDIRIRLSPAKPTEQRPDGAAPACSS